MIRRIEVVFRRTGVWSGGSAYPTKNTKYRDGQVVWAKDYPRGKHMSDVWSELRRNTIGLFIDNMYPDVVDRTKPPEPRHTAGQSPSQALQNQSKYIQNRHGDYPTLYKWFPDMGKWAMTETAYARRTVQFGGHIDIGVSERVSDTYYDDTLIDQYERQLSGQTKSFVLMVFPDRYDEEVRSLFELRITFW